MIVAHTDVLIGFLAEGQPAAERVAIELESRSFGPTAVTRFGLLVGARDKTAERLIRRLLGTLPTLLLDGAAARY